MLTGSWLDFFDDAFMWPSLHRHWHDPLPSLPEQQENVWLDQSSGSKTLKNFGAIDIQVNPDAYVIEVDVPTRKEDIELYVKDDKVLTICAKRHGGRSMQYSGGKWSVTDEQKPAIESRPTTDSPTDEQENVRPHAGSQEKEYTGESQMQQQQQQQTQTHTQQQRPKHVLKERWSGSFQRSFQVPPDADVSKMRTCFENGVLTICLPRISQKEHAQSEQSMGEKMFGRRIEL